MSQEKTYKWIQDRLRELNAGTIAAADFHQLESLAKDDPFVADALEGYQAHPDLNHSEHLNSLTQRIKTHKRERRRWLIPNLTVTAVAASLILIVGFYAVMMRISKPHDEGLATGTTSEHKLAIKQSGDTMAIVPDQENTIAAAEPSQPVAAVEAPRVGASRQSISKNSASKENKKEIAATEATRSQPADENYVLEDTKTKSVSPPNSKESVQPKTDELPTAPAGAAEKQDATHFWSQTAPQLMKTKVTGKVIEEFGEPLMGAKISINGTNKFAETDLDGNFELYLPDLENEVTVSYTGFPDTSFIVKQGDKDLKIVLRVQYISMPVIISTEAMGKNANSNSSRPVIDSTAIVRTNDVTFIDYLKTNSKFPLAENLNIPAKTVTLEFTINADGHPNQIKVTQSSGEKNLDDEAMRLIKKGPDWQCNTLQYPCKVKYSIYFKT